jgi:hypothetical protein
MCIALHAKRSGRVLPGWRSTPRRKLVAVENDPVKVLELRQAVCDDCGWHAQPVAADDAGKAASREWARLHRVAGCPLKKPRLMLADLDPKEADE